ncbi:MAG: XRE family transcriptional regulator [Roseburia sp.]|nr:XRE family transcriptional regulator [Roseburia sp.]MCM1097252.1 XRE family transcriptional regulator [Ruminococcus flavefaciens]
MQLKTTEELNHEIKSATDIEDYLKGNPENLITSTLSAHLNSLLSQKKFSKADVVKDSNLYRTYVYQIFSGEKTPSRDILIAIAFGLHLSEEEAQTLLKVSKNRELYARDERDAIILFAIQRNMPIMKVNELLFEHDLQPLAMSKE